MGQEWDGWVPGPEVWKECLRVLKPGGHLLAFAGTRTMDMMSMSIRMGGFELRDSIGYAHDQGGAPIMAWVHAQGFPKSTDISEAIDRQGGIYMGWVGPWLKEQRERAGMSRDELAKHFPSKNGGQTGCIWNWEMGIRTPSAEQFDLLCELLKVPQTTRDEISLQRGWIVQPKREVIAERRGVTKGFNTGAKEVLGKRRPITAAATDNAKKWEGWGTGLKPAWEPVIVARKPMVGTVVQNLREHGVGAINIDGSRIGDEVMIVTKSIGVVKSQNRAMGGPNYEREVAGTVTGRFPTNVIHDGSDEVEGIFASFGHTSSFSGGRSTGRNFGQEHDDGKSKDRPRVGHDDEGTASRFFFCAKPSKAEKADGHHPTVKPMALMRYLLGLVVPPGGVVIDPFAGSGTTGAAALALGLDAVLIEREAEYVDLIKRRLSA
jgi:site-specific DNA-methyltransferase (adenine-specific)